MDIEDEYTYETTIEDIVFHLEQLIADVILASIKRLSAEYKETTLKLPPEKEKDDKF
jgi:hypothetical protein